MTSPTVANKDVFHDDELACIVMSIRATLACRALTQKLQSLPSRSDMYSRDRHVVASLHFRSPRVEDTHTPWRRRAVSPNGGRSNGILRIARHSAELAVAQTQTSLRRTRFRWMQHGGFESSEITSMIYQSCGHTMDAISVNTNAVPE
ncbi:PREDICTED: uncharacterized protein LOC106748384 [Dinoponera quadriceps]|uniref:Uncharacterized protein LOC106748384 n=1 Tax=Dinoponera quadriceps TaxID=609295 RepID=A0A6P3XUU2_DINQU|nr:PREDICTED: uncharacterized protein LOC106748384 [Dinoponera quadriceps]